MKDKRKYRINIQWREEDNCYLIALPDISKGQEWVTHGDTPWTMPWMPWKN